MLGYISCGDGPRRPTLERRQLLGTLFTVVRVEEGQRGILWRGRLAAAARRAYAQGVRQAVFPEDIPCADLFFRQGIVPVEVLPMRHALAAPLVQRQLTARGLSGTQAAVAISGQRLSRQLMETAKTLAIRYRYVLLDVPGGESFARYLRREYGISLLLSPGREQMERADALLLYSPREGLRESGRILYALYPGGDLGWDAVRYGLPAALAEQVEPNCCREQLLAALYGAGSLPLENILDEIEVDRTGKYRYNAYAL